ncbi:MAG TPA: TatD family hydrolase [Chloroflexi bacterium]|nr:TatD family hydrolase [Chloroflexota bacterium]HPO59411.1 TatD family hydrolase [Anaerolineaceae bacterium]
MRLADTHCHLLLQPFQSDVDSVLSRAWDEGVDRILIPGTTLEDSRAALEFCERDDRLYVAVGVHPNESLTWQDSSAGELRALAAHPRVVAIGEIGLDYYRSYAPQDVQRKALLQQLEVAAEIGLPVIIHCRDAIGDLLPILLEWREGLAAQGNSLANRPGVFHSFSDSLEHARQAIAAGFFIGITGPVTFRNAAERQQITQALPVQSMLVETDAPYLTPHPHRGKRNEPAFVRHIAQKIADLTQSSLETVAEITSANADRLFLWRTPD